MDDGGAGATEGLDPVPLAEALTGLWRARRRVLRDDEDPVGALRRTQRHVEFTWDAFASAGFDIQDHNGMPFDTGLALSVVAFQPDPGVDRERVIETIRPSVYLRGRCIQAGEVIVGIPAQPNDIGVPEQGDGRHEP